MKELFLILLLLTTICSNSLFSQRFILNGKIIGQGEGYIYLNFLNKDEVLSVDSAEIKEGIFVFKNEICFPHWATVYRKINNKKEDKIFFIEPCEMSIILETNKFDSAIITGSKTENEFNKIRLSEIETKKRAGIIRNRLDSLLFIQKNDTMGLLNDAITLLQNEQDRLKDKINKIEYEYIVTHPISYASANLLWGHMADLTLDSLKLLFSKLDNSITNSVGGKYVKAFINGSEGGTAPDFSAVDINGKLITLYSFKNEKYVLIDFWASWCVPCRRDNPYLISIYNKYHSKGLEIIGVSKDRDVDKWKKAINDDMISIWYHIIEPTQWKDWITTKFAVVPIPVIILIDKTGKVIYRHEGNDDEELLDKKLVEIFK